MPLTLYAIYWTEVEVGWGTRPDGLSVHIDHDAAEQFIKDYWDKMPKERPAEYSEPGTPEQIEVSQEVYDIVAMLKNAWASHRSWVIDNDLLRNHQRKHVKDNKMSIDLRAGPLSPKDVSNAKQVTFPPEVFEAFNTLITENFNAGSARVVQKDAVAKIVSLMNLEKDDIVYEKGWLNVEDVYRKAGWKVEYDKPAYNETYNAYFVFSKKRGS